MSGVGRRVGAVVDVEGEVGGPGAVAPTPVAATLTDSAEEGRVDHDERPDAPVQAFAETDYCYGVGPLHLRMDRIDWSRPVRYDGDTWYYVHGVQIGQEGMELGQRQVLV